jgi:Asp-tRNA(Asn)/Glu-tRNA(Gln) amidotransferase A subunit family amidase
MAEFAFTPYETVSSILPGYTKNPYALDRVTAGSSGGTAAGVSAGLGLVGLGTDTGNSIRGPVVAHALVGIRGTMGLASRAGVVPLNLDYDVAGPMARTVADAAAVLQVVAGADSDDPATNAVRGRPRPAYAASLVRTGLRGARVGVLRQAFEQRTGRPRGARGVRARGGRPAPRRRHDRRQHPDPRPRLAAQPRERGLQPLPLRPSSRGWRAPAARRPCARSRRW